MTQNNTFLFENQIGSPSLAQVGYHVARPMLYVIIIMSSSRSSLDGVGAKYLWFLAMSGVLLRPALSDPQFLPHFTHTFTF